VFVQLIGTEVDAVAVNLSFTARAVLVDLLCRSDWRTGRYATTQTDYAAALNLNRRRLSDALRELNGAALVAGCDFGPNRVATIEVNPDVYERCVHLTASSRQVRAEYARESRGNRAETARIRANHQGKRDTDTDGRCADGQMTELDIDRLAGTVARYVELGGTRPTDDDLARLLTYCYEECFKAGADRQRIIDESLGRLDTAVTKQGKRIEDIAGYFRGTVRTLIRERLGVAS
jgi:hypothetical protein